MWIRSLGTTVSQQVKKNICEYLLLTKVSSISFYSSVSVANTSEIKNSSSFIVISYLINSGGLSENEAISVSKKIHFETTSKPDSVISLLESYGFTKPCISKLITKRPSILSSEPEISLKPKFDFFISKGISGIGLAKFISSDPRILRESLTTQIIPVFDILKGNVHCDENVITILRRHPWILGNKLGIKNMMLNIELLRDEGVPQSNISRFLIEQPRSSTVTTVKFKEIIEEVKSMGFDPSKTAFLPAIQTLTGMSKSTWEKKMNAYKGWGWSEDVIMNAFKHQTQCMGTSEKKITLTMDYLVNQMGWSSSLIASHPVVFSYSLEKRIIPRCSVYRILTSKGLVKNQFAMSSLIIMPEKAFSMKFVKEYAEEVPELLNVYQGKFNSQELPNSSASGRLSEGK
ncbi:uncharacterized protein LOC113307763 [Papaver somniferum]|nr:uncharacterized protein LOC113307763 [Papaver somniferum]